MRVVLAKTLALYTVLLILTSGCSGGGGQTPFVLEQPRTLPTGGDSAEGSPFGFHPALAAKIGYADNGYKDAQTIGVKWTREGVYAFWFKVQPDLNKQVYDFSLYDQQWSKVPKSMRILGNIAPQGIADLGYCRPNSYLPVDEQKYIAFVKATVERYDGDGVDDMPGLANPIKYWQVGNEPNGAIPGFADLQRITYTAIKEACPDCTILIGGVPGMPPVAAYLNGFDQQYKPILDALGGKYVDVMDFHWYGTATGDYRGAKEVYDHIRQVLEADGFSPDLPIWITEMGSYSGDPAPGLNGNDYPAQTEGQQALDYFKRFIYPLSFGVKKVFPAFGLMEGLAHDDSYFDHTGLIYDGMDSGDAGLGVKKLGYFTYRKMTEVLEGADWSGITAVRESGDVYVYKVVKDGKAVFAAWWDYFNDASYAPGRTVDLALSGLDGIAAVVTEVVPKFAAGSEVTDYSSAFATRTFPVSGGTATITLGDSPVLVETKTLTPIKKVAITTDAEGGSARPEVVATDDRVFAVYLGHLSGGFNTKSFDVKVYDTELSSVVTTTTIVPPSLSFGSATDIRIARDGQYVFTFYETSTTTTTYLHGAKYALNDSFDLVARAQEPIASARPVFQTTEGDEVLNDPAPLVGPDSVFVVTRLMSSITTTGQTIYRVREFTKDTLAQVRQFDLDLSGVADGRARVTSLLFRGNSIYIALATTVSDQGVDGMNLMSDDGAQSDILLVRMNPDWTFDPLADVRTLSSEAGDRENYITGLRADDSFFYLAYKQAVGAPPTGEQRAVIKLFDGDLGLVHKEIVVSTPWGPGGGEIRPSLEISGSRIYSGQSMGASLGSGNAQILVYDLKR